MPCGNTIADFAGKGHQERVKQAVVSPSPLAPGVSGPSHELWVCQATRRVMAVTFPGATSHLLSEAPKGILSMEVWRRLLCGPRSRLLGSRKTSESPPSPFPRVLHALFAARRVVRRNFTEAKTPSRKA